MTRAITVRLDEADHVALEKQAEQVGLRPGTLARILVHAGLSESSAFTDRANAHTARADALAALERWYAGLKSAPRPTPSPWWRKRGPRTNPIDERCVDGNMVVATMMADDGQLIHVDNRSTTWPLASTT